MNSYLFVYCYGNPKIHAIHTKLICETNLVDATKQFNKERNQEEDCNIIIVVKL